MVMAVENRTRQTRQECIKVSVQWRHFCTSTPYIMISYGWWKTMTEIWRSGYLGPLLKPYDDRHEWSGTEWRIFSRRVAVVVSWRSIKHLANFVHGYGYQTRPHHKPQKYLDKGRTIVSFSNCHCYTLSPYDHMYWLTRRQRFPLQ